MKKKGKVLDVACGYGGLMKGLQKYRKNLKFTGIDIAKSMIAVGRKYIANKKINFDLMSADNINFENESFDYVICKDSFHHFKNPAQGMKELLSLVKNGGTLYIYDLTRDAPLKQIARRLNTFEAEHEKKRFLASINASLTLAEMRELLRKIGITKFQYFYPLHFSKRNLKNHRSWIKKDKTKEHTFHTLSRIYLIKKP